MRSGRRTIEVEVTAGAVMITSSYPDSTDIHVIPMGREVHHG